MLRAPSFRVLCEGLGAGVRMPLVPQVRVRSLDANLGRGVRISQRGQVNQ
jgi:hypothetical protein